MSGISEYLHGLLTDYTQYRGCDHRDPEFKPFWDVVVITTADADQREAFQVQIEEKRRRRELPKGLPVHVVADPPGVRIGNGGSTMLVLEFLESEYGEDWNQLKTFLIHAGGWSQRMPSASVLGKIFSILPYGDPPFQILDLKLAFYWPFVEKIQRGVFLTCADDFTIHNLGTDSSVWSTSGKGFTALAHPSPMSLGRAHGVYVVDTSEELDLTQHVVRRKCLQVLQKPDDERMRNRGALLPSKESFLTFADDIRLEGDVVYTDSCFYFGEDVMEKLLNLKKSLGELTCEIDAYGDIIQSVGQFATPDYIHNTANVSNLTESLLECRKRVFDTLNGSDIEVLLLNASAYIHIGTTTELLDYMCRNELFQERLNFKKDVFNSWTNTENESNGVKDGDVKKEDSFLNSKNVSKYSCVIHSSVHSSSFIGDDTYIEFCNITSPVKILGNSIVSNCQLAAIDEITIPESTFLHTIPISVRGSRRESQSSFRQNIDVQGEDVTHFVTIVCHIKDDLKKSLPVADIGSLPYNGYDVNTYLNQRSMTLKEILPSDVNSKYLNSDTNKNCLETKSKKNNISMWNLKIFPSFQSMTSSALDAIAIRKGEKVKVGNGAGSNVFYSLADLLRVKDVKEMLSYRRDLYTLIIDQRGSH